MIYLGCGLILVAIGVIWLISPAKQPNRVYGYLSYLAQVNKASFKFARKKASLYNILFGMIQTILGIIIHLIGWDRYFLIWLLTFYLFIIFPIIWTEKSLQRFLKENGSLPPDYVEPDQVKRTRTKGFRDK